MSVIQVAIPVLRGRTTIVVDKGRPWSVVEHLILEALAKKGWTVVDLSKSARIPRRVVIEAIIRLMRAGWVDLSESKSEVVFHTNSFGLAAAAKTELPKIFQRISRQINFSIDLVDGDVFRNREWFLYNEYNLSQREYNELIVRIEPESVANVYDRDEFYEVLLEYDETLVSAEPSGFSRQFALVTVRNGVIEGLPDRELTNLRAAVLEASLSVDPKIVDGRHLYRVPGLATASRALIPEEREIHFNASDLVLDGEAHKLILKNIFDNADKRIFIHSTFIDEEKFLNWLPDITAASNRGVRTHVFWGQNEDVSYMVSSRKVISNLKKNPKVQALGESLIIYPFSTMSHAKLIVADAGKDGSFIAVVGSCNWFTSGFNSYEASVFLRDSRIVRDVVRYFTELSFAHNGIYSDLATELFRISKSLEETPISVRTNAKASIVIGSQHGSYILQARDEAKERIFVTSHRLGPISEASVVTPIMTGATTNKVKADVYFGRTTGAMRGEKKDALVEKASCSGVSVELIEAPRLHAKMLAWDDDSVLISSLNWLSAVSADLSTPKEIGVYIHGKNIAKAVIDNFDGARKHVQNEN